MTVDRGNVLVTGSSSGMGRACAIRLSRAGFRVFACVRKQQDGEEVGQEASGSIVPVILDVTKSDTISAAVAFVPA